MSSGRSVILMGALIAAFAAGVGYFSWVEKSSPRTSLANDPFDQLRGTPKEHAPKGPPDLEGALADLERSLTASPANAQGWLTMSAILLARGQFQAAMQTCKPLAQLSGPLVAAGCEASVLSVAGQARAAIDRLQAVLQNAGQRPAAERAWAWAIVGETASRIADLQTADAAFKAGLATGAPDGYLLDAYLDHLLDQQKYNEVLDVARHQTFAPEQLLRYAIAARGLGRPEYAKHRVLLEPLLDRRELARWHLELDGESRKALELAKENWGVQREPADVRVLLAAALAEKDRASAELAIEFVEKSKLEGVRIQQMIARLKALTPDLKDKLAAEAKARAAGTPRIEDLIAQARAQGIELNDAEQGLASAVDAAYCAATMTKSGVGATLCEYADEAKLAAGRTLAEKRFSMIPDRTFAANRATLLILRVVVKSEQAERDQSALAEIFSKL